MSAVYPGCTPARGARQGRQMVAGGVGWRQLRVQDGVRFGCKMVSGPGDTWCQVQVSVGLKWLGRLTNGVGRQIAIVSVGSGFGTIKN